MRPCHRVPLLFIIYFKEHQSYSLPVIAEGGQGCWEATRRLGCPLAPVEGVDPDLDNLTHTRLRLAWRGRRRRGPYRGGKTVLLFKHWHLLRRLVMFYTAQTGESPGDTLATGRPLPEENVSKVWELFLLRVTCKLYSSIGPLGWVITD